MGECGAGRFWLPMVNEQLRVILVEETVLVHLHACPPYLVSIWNDSKCQCDVEFESTRTSAVSLKGDGCRKGKRIEPSRRENRGKDREAPGRYTSRDESLLPDKAANRCVRMMSGGQREAA
jgi:hypothetical protein